MIKLYQGFTEEERELIVSALSQYWAVLSDSYNEDQELMSKALEAGLAARIAKIEEIMNIIDPRRRFR